MKWSKLMLPVLLEWLVCCVGTKYVDKSRCHHSNQIFLSTLFPSQRRLCPNAPMQLRGGGERKSVVARIERRKSSKGMLKTNDNGPLSEQGSDEVYGDHGDSDSESRNENIEQSDMVARRSENALDKKLKEYAKKYGLSSGPPANPLRMLLEKAEKSMDARTKFKIKKERFVMQRKEIDRIRKQLKDDDSRRKCRSGP